jgi:3-oxoacyl-[acyl-carrier-protein] synthase II
LESRASAARRGVPILAEVVGFATTSDTSSIANPDIGAMERCMRLALNDAGLTAADIDYINAHATGTGQGDIAEAEAIRAIFADAVPVSSLKGHLGHTMAASGAIELAASVGMMQQQRLVATRNLLEIDERCRGIAHLQHNQDRSARTVLKNNFAMGGINCTIIIRSHTRD